MNRSKKMGWIIEWTSFIVCSIILLFDRDSGSGTYLGCTIVIIGSIIALYCIFKKNK